MRGKEGKMEGKDGWGLSELYERGCVRVWGCRSVGDLECEVSDGRAGWVGVNREAGGRD